jgi:hypothetical protein
MQGIDLNVLTDEKPPKPIEVIANGQSYVGKSGLRRELGDEMLIKKFLDNTSPYLSSTQIKEITSTILQLEELPTIAKLMDLVRQ